MSGYQIGFGITAFLTFWVSYIYCFFAYGFLLGGALGWIPSMIVAVIAGALWPLILLCLIGGFLFFLHVVR